MPEDISNVYHDAIAAVECALDTCGLVAVDSRRVTGSASMGTYDVRVGAVEIDDETQSTCRYTTTFALTVTIRTTSGGDTVEDRRKIDALRYKVERAVLAVEVPQSVAHIGVPATISAVEFAENGAQFTAELTCKAWETWP